MASSTVDASLPSTGAAGNSFLPFVDDAAVAAAVALDVASSKDPEFPAVVTAASPAPGLAYGYGKESKAPSPGVP